MVTDFLPLFAGLGEFLDSFFYPIFKATDESALASAVKASNWLVPWAGAIHLLGLGLLGGAVLLVDMRVIGSGVKSVGPAEVMHATRPYLALAIAVLVFSGVTIGLGQAMRLFGSPPYWLKMAGLAAALVFTFGVRNRLISNGGQLTAVNIAMAAISLILFFGVFAWVSNTLAQVALGLLIVALLIWVFLAGRGSPKAATMDGARQGWTTKSASVLNIIMWMTVAASGRWIAFW